MRHHYHNYDVAAGRYRFILDEMPANSRVLEVGCFLGRYCNHFAELGHDPVGIDLSPEVIAEGKRLHPHLDLRCLDGSRMSESLEAGSFDAVVASEVIEHVLFPQDFLTEIHRCLKPDGRLLLTTQNSNGIQYRLQMLVGKFRWDPTHLRLYSKPELRTEIEQGGFRVEKMKGIPINPKGPSKASRWFAYASALVNPNFCWTWGVVAKPIK